MERVNYLVYYNKEKVNSVLRIEFLVECIREIVGCELAYTDPKAIKQGIIMVPSCLVESREKIEEMRWIQSVEEGRYIKAEADR